MRMQAKDCGQIRVIPQLVFTHLDIKIPKWFGKKYLARKRAILHDIEIWYELLAKINR
ncbi:hypothetical protein ACJX0J_011891, partial [Zea mays]